MPLFDFHCDHCDEEFEELLPSAKDIKGVQCPSCGSAEVSRLISGFALPSGGGFSSAASSSSCSSGPFR